MKDLLSDSGTPCVIIDTHKLMRKPLITKDYQPSKLAMDAVATAILLETKCRMENPRIKVVFLRGA